MVTCRDILNLNLDGVKLIGGEKGLDRLVSWSYMVQTRPYAEHMNQGNFAMIVVDYVRFDFDEVRKTMEELYELGISGLAISVTEEKEKVRDWIEGQNSDGFGEGLEQREIETEDGDLFVSMWNFGDDYFVYDEEELAAHLAGQSIGGISQ